MIDKYKFEGDRPFRINDYPKYPLKVYSKKESKKIIKENVKAIEDFRERLAFEQRRSILVVFQAIDAAGKDGTIKRLVTGLNSAGVEVSSFKKPSDEELDHDFLWRIHKKVPRKGVFGIFNRSHYEEVLVTRVHPSFIVSQKLPGILKEDDITEEFWERRFHHIREFENHLVENGTVIIKFFLNVSKEEQKQRILDRIEEPDKRWKFSLTDVKQRKYWDDYQNAFEDMVNKTSQKHAPWYVIPADDKPTLRALVTTKIKDEMEKIHLHKPVYEGDFETDSKLGIQLLDEL